MRKILQLTSRLLILPLFLAALLFLNQQATSQSALATWGDLTKETSLTYGRVTDYGSLDEEVRKRQSIDGGKQCENYPIIFRPAWHPAGAQMMEGCWHSTSVGEINNTGVIYHPTGWEVGGYVNSHNSQVFPTVHPNRFIELTPIDGALRYQLSIRKSDGPVDEMTVTPADTGWDFPVFLDWVYEPSLTLKTADNKIWEFDYNTMLVNSWGSENGRHLVLWQDSGYFLLIDLQTLELKTITSSYSGYVHVSVSNDGQYVAISTPSIQGFQVIDTGRCNGQAASHVGEPLACVTRTILNELYEDGLEHAFGGSLPTFYGNDLVTYYMPHESEYREYVFRAPNTRQDKNYIALGDSYTSGEGAGNYFRGTAVLARNACHLSRVSHPLIIGSVLDMDSSHSIACSGATSFNIVGGHPNDAAQYPKIPDSLTELGRWQPGEKWQIEFIRDPEISTDVISLGIGGNDIGFGDKVYRCVLYPDDCFDSDEDRLAIAYEISGKFDRLVTVFSATRRSALDKNPSARIFAVGYPSIVSTRGNNCGVNVRLSDKERRLANDLIYDLNDTIRLAAKRAGIVYVDIYSSLFGYRLCETTDKPAMHGATARPRSSSYHPTDFGQALIASRIIAATNKYGIPLPFPDKTVVAPDPNKGLLTHSLSSFTEFSLRLAYGYSIQADVLIKNVDVLDFLLSRDYRLRSNEYYDLFFTSEPTYLGKFMTNNDGELSIHTAIPDSLAPGFHTFHIRGLDTEGRDINIYKGMFIAAYENDWNGDGVPDNEDPCGFFSPTGIDEDRDGIDDGCDSFISLAPPTNAGAYHNQGGQAIRADEIEFSGFSGHMPFIQEYVLGQSEALSSVEGLANSGSDESAPGRKPIPITALIVTVCLVASYLARRLLGRKQNS